jgi:proline iminopeptidase
VSVAGEGSGQQGTLAVDRLHTIWWQQSGNPVGEPVVMLHAGPGGRSNPDLRSIFDNQDWCLVQTDQRGCGHSTPAGELRDNTTAHLVADLEALRQHLAIERWSLFGQSWGSALALAYAQAHPERCKGLLLSAIYLGDRQDVHWFFDGPKALLPDAHADLAAHVPEAEHADLLQAYHRRVSSHDRHISVPAARAFMAYDLWLIPLHPDTERPRDVRSDGEVLAFARIFLHYLHNTFFLGDGVLLGGVPRIAHLPARIVMGRHDIAVSLRPAWALKQAWPAATWRVVPEGAYSPYQPAMRAALAEEAAALLNHIRTPRPP